MVTEQLDSVEATSLCIFSAVFTKQWRTPQDVPMGQGKCTCLLILVSESLNLITYYYLSFCASLFEGRNRSFSGGPAHGEAGMAHCMAGRANGQWACEMDVSSVRHGGG